MGFQGLLDGLVGFQGVSGMFQCDAERIQLRELKGARYALKLPKNMKCLKTPLNTRNALKLPRKPAKILILKRLGFLLKTS